VSNTLTSKSTIRVDVGMAQKKSRYVDMTDLEVGHNLLTPDDREVIRLTLGGDYNLFFEWFFTDVKLQDHQLKALMAPQTSVLLLGGRGSGKTFGFIAGYLMFCVLMPDLRVLWGSYTADQAAIPFNDVLYPLIESSPRFHKFLPKGMDSLRKKPYPIVEVKVPGTNLPASKIVFRTFGEEGKRLRGLTVDIIHYDEGGMDHSDATINTLKPCLRGRRNVKGRPLRLGRFSVSTTPTAAPWLRHWWECATNKDYPDHDPVNYYAARVSTDHNLTLTPEQIENMQRDMSPEERAVEMQAGFPEYMGTDFSPMIVNRCEDSALNNELATMIEKNRPGAQSLLQPRIGALIYQKPAIPGHHYIVVGDPGAGDPPYRNAPVVLAWDVTQKPYELVCFRWVHGRGSYRPFFNEFHELYDFYKPIYSCFDATGTQMAMEELYFEDRGLMVEGMSVTTEKPAMINTAKIMMQRGDLRFPFIQGLRLQLLNYKQEEDKKQDQDIVMALVMSCWKMRAFTFTSAEEQQSTDKVTQSFLDGRTRQRDGRSFEGRIPRRASALLRNQRENNGRRLSE